MVHNVLTNPRYTGRWEFGRYKNVWSVKKQYSRKERREKPLASFEDEALRIIDDEVWHAAQQRLSHYKDRAGRRPRQGAPKTAPRTLNGLLVCEFHPDHPLRVWGHSGDSMACHLCRRDARPALFTLLPRPWALRVICGKLATLLRSDADLVERAIGECRRLAEAAERPSPARRKDLEQKIDKLSRQIDYVLDAPAENDVDKAENHAKVKKLRAARDEVQHELAALEAALKRPIVVPTPEEVRQRIDVLADLLITAAGSEDPALQSRVRQVIEQMTGGTIVVSQCGEPKRQRGGLRGTFTLRLLQAFLEEFHCGCEDGDVRIAHGVCEARIASRRHAKSPSGSKRPDAAG